MVKANKKRRKPGAFVVFLRLTGVEPALLAKIDPKSIVYANFTTGAEQSIKVYHLFSALSSAVSIDTIENVCYNNMKIKIKV